MIKMEDLVLEAHNDDKDIDLLTQEYNVAIANGLVMKARRINRVLQSLERGSR